MASAADINGPTHDENPITLNVNSLDEYSEYLEMPVYTQKTVITAQPNSDMNPNRRPIPVSTLDWVSTNMTHMIPPSGLDFLRGVTELQIQQTVELVDILAYVESENRFQVKVPEGETIYVAAEGSSKTQRMCCASNRAFQIKLFDRSQQEAMRFTRNLACSSWLFGCFLQELQVFSDVDMHAGSVIQEWNVTTPLFKLTNTSNTVMFRLVGPKSATTCCGNNYQARFDLLNPECTTRVGSIVHTWDNLSSDYSLLITFPTSQEVTIEMKAVILGAAFLLEYMYFETSKRRGFLSWFQ
ncbi:hypothetical protein L9F63_014716 [Diploptera punctata]|uniref:Phospholipid scramblase n=1 Tax=Diploptera punctata TaxID=6984 RepID=A0AAD8EKM3_DIPPU|nr:hypothetical protein L9F63_014716 [Diploptera punctata]